MNAPISASALLATTRPSKPTPTSLNALFAKKVQPLSKNFTSLDLFTLVSSH